MKRIMISGFGCPKEPWMSLLGPGTTVITLHEVLEATRSSAIEDWARYVADALRRIRPDSIVAHDFGGTTTIKALLLLQEQKVRLHARLTLLNTAFRDFDVLQNPHPFLMQIAPWSLITRLIQASGGEVDPELRPWIGTVRKVYRKVIVGSFARRIQLRLYAKDREHEALDIDLGLPAQIIASGNDPYIDLACLRSIQDDFLIPEFHIISYRHFPYSSQHRQDVRKLIHRFEAGERALHGKVRH